VNKYVKVRIRERIEGQPGFAKPHEFDVHINPDQVTLLNRGEENNDITFVRLSCGVTLCVIMKEDKLIKLLEKE